MINQSNQQADKQQREKRCKSTNMHTQTHTEKCKVVILLQLFSTPEVHSILKHDHSSKVT